MLLWVAGLLLGAWSARSHAADDQLFYAARDGQVARLQRILEDGALPDTRHESGLTALMWAATTGQEGAITALLEAG